MKIKIQLKRVALAMTLVLNLFVVAMSYANNISVGRYLAVSATPQKDQQQLLQQQIQVRFPQNILTIKQAVNFLLQFSGYQLATENTISVSVNTMLEQPLPEVDKNFGPMSLEQGLVTLSGDSFYLLIDPVNRLVSFKLKPSYEKLYEPPNKKIKVLKLKRKVK